MIKHGVLIAIFAAIWFGCLDQVSAAVRHVGYGERYPTIQMAVDAAESGDIIQIKAGTYVSTQPIVIAYKDRLTLRGKDHVQVMTPNIYKGTDYLPVIAILHSNDITVNNLHALHDRQPSWGSGCGGPVIFVENSTNVIVEDCELNGSGAIGVQAVGATNLAIKHNHIHHNSYSAFDLRDSAAIKIANNQIENNGQFLVKTNVERLELMGNRIESN